MPEAFCIECQARLVQKEGQTCPLCTFYLKEDQEIRDTNKQWLWLQNFLASLGGQDNLQIVWGSRITKDSEEQIIGLEWTRRKDQISISQVCILESKEELVLLNKNQEISGRLKGGWKTEGIQERIWKEGDRVFREEAMRRVEGEEQEKRREELEKEAREDLGEGIKTHFLWILGKEGIEKRWDKIGIEVLGIQLSLEEGGVYKEYGVEEGWSGKEMVEILEMKQGNRDREKRLKEELKKSRIS